MAENDVISIIKLLRAKAQEVEGFDNEISLTLQTLFDQLDKYESIDKEMVAKLTGIFQNSLENKDVFDMAKAIDEGSTIVYFKSAQLFKVYRREELMSLLDGHLRTVFKHFNQSFEVVPNNSEQKIIIMGDITLVDQIDHIKKYILQFMIDKGVQDFKNDDIVCFKNENTNMIEIVINNYYVNNSSERDEIVQDLLKYILRMEKNSNMTRKLGYMPDCIEFENADVVSMPSEKQLLDEDNRFIEMVDRLVRNTSKCSKLVKEGNTYIINLYNNVETVNNGVINNIDSPHSDLSDGISDFGKHIRENKPNWYIEGELFDKQLLRDKYIELYGEISKAMFHKTFMNKIFKKTVRVTIKNVRVAKVLLFNYDDILDIDGE
jgi:hypothetical protein